MLGAAPGSKGRRLRHPSTEMPLRWAFADICADARHLVRGLGFSYSFGNNIHNRDETGKPA
jgi:hypothetical protein